ncbi:MAG: hypothetical protein OXI11_03995 [Gammaproteobacteria bacterium]|nr:hypothetical protein [Gammaproteobacteria bacterium]
MNDLLKNHDLSGANLVAECIAVCERGEHTIETLLVALAPARLRVIRPDIPNVVDAIKKPNLALYAAVCAAGGGHCQYNAL